MDGAHVLLGARIDSIQHLICRFALRRAPTIRLQDGMHEGIRVAVTESKFTFEVIAELAVFGLATFLNDGSQRIIRL